MSLRASGAAFLAVYLPAWLNDAVEDAARTEGISVSAWCREVFERQVVLDEKKASHEPERASRGVRTPEPE